MAQDKDLGLRLVAQKVLTQEQLEAAQKDQEEKGGSLGAAVGRLGFAEEGAVARALANLRGVKFVDVSTLKADIMEQLAKLVPAEIAHKYRAIPVSKFKERFTFAVADPAEPALIGLRDEFFRGRPGQAEFCVSLETSIGGALEKYFPNVKKPPAPAGEGLDNTLGEVGAVKLADGADGGETIDVEVVPEAADTDTEGAVDDAPVIQLVNRVIYDAVEKKASDIHFDPHENEIVLRYRIDGVLHDVMKIPKQWKKPIAAVVKVKTKKMKIEERRRPQDAQIKIKVPSREKPVDLRVSTLPIYWGEKIVMRILDSSDLPKLQALGMEDDELEKVNKAIHMPQGMIIVTGPTGSGKTNTLYSAISEVNTRSKNILTAENPVEFQLAGINQVQINPEAGLTFAAALKAFLRQDPNIILVGEVRDFEEVDTAVKAAMTGHLVFTTLHTNDAPSTVQRLLDVRDPISGQGVDPAIIASAVNIVLAQRLMRRICTECKKPTTYEKEFFLKTGLNPADYEGAQLYKGEGCQVCNKTGYKKRVGIFEAMVMSRALRDLVMQRKDANVLRDQAVKEGMRTLRQSAILKARNGISTLEEVVEATIE